MATVKRELVALLTTIPFWTDEDDAKIHIER
jgi:hypothetical protein